MYERNKSHPMVLASAVSDRSYYIKLNDNRLIMIDFGCVNLTVKGVSYRELFENYIKELQKVCQSEIVKIAALFITHPHDDHVNFLEYLKKSGQDKYFVIEKVIRNFPQNWVPKNNWEKPEYPALIEDILKSLKGTEVITAKRGDVYEIGNIKFEILLTPDEAPEDAKDLNYFSLLIKQTYMGKTLLWTGDMSDSLSKKAIELYGENLKCDILQVPHHGTPNCGVPQFFELCNAKTHLWTIAEKTFTDPEYIFTYGKYPTPTFIFDMPVKKVFCGGENPIEIIL